MPTELDDRALENIGGGFNEYETDGARCDLNSGDTFQVNGTDNRYVVELGGMQLSGSQPVACTLYTYLSAEAKYREVTRTRVSVDTLLADCTYCGNGCIREEDILREDRPVFG